MRPKDKTSLGCRTRANIFDQDGIRHSGQDEGDCAVLEAEGRLAHYPVPSSPALVYNGLHISDFKGNVMQAALPLPQESRDGTIWSGWLDKLDIRSGANLDKTNIHPLYAVMERFAHVSTAEEKLVLSYSFGKI